MRRIIDMLFNLYIFKEKALFFRIVYDRSLYLFFQFSLFQPEINFKQGIFIFRLNFSGFSNSTLKKEFIDLKNSLQSYLIKEIYKEHQNVNNA